MKSPAIIALFLLITISCTTIAPQLPIDLPSRDPAAQNDCIEIASNIIKADQNPVSTKNFIGPLVYNKDPSLTHIIHKRMFLNKKYEEITESIKDFEVHPDLPINAKTKLVLDPREGYLAKIMMIRNAKKTIDLSYYIFKDEDTGNALLHEVRMAIKRGVKVRILIDSSGSIAKAPFYDDIKALVALSGRAILDSEGKPTGERAFAEAVLFNPVFNIRAHVSNWYKKIHNLFASENNQLPMATFTVNRRSHDKILLTDAHSSTDSMAIIGGRNIADRYYGVGEGEENPILDAEILIKGFAQSKEAGSTENILEDHYNKIYFYLANKNFENFLFKTNQKTVKKEFHKMRVAKERLLSAPDAPLKAQLDEMLEKDFLNEGFEDGMISVLNEIQNLSRTKIFFAPNGPQNKKNGNSLMAKLHSQVEKATKSVDIISPYFWIPDEEVDFLMKWAAADPKRKVRIFSNSITTTDNLVAQAMVDATVKNNIIKRIKNSGVERQFEIFSYGKLDDEVLGGNTRYGFLHAKIAIVDGASITVSTSNLDPISRHLNSEIGVAIENLPANSKNIAYMKNYVDDLERNSTIWGSSEWQEIRNHPKNKVAGIMQAFITKIIYALNLIPIL